MEVRPATIADLDAIMRLFNALIPTTTIAWRDELATRAEMEEWWVHQERAGAPTLVADKDGEVIGYTTWTSFRGGPRFPGYRYAAELTIHVDGRCHRQGVGRALLTALIDVAREREIHVLVAGLDADNASSIALHRALGFEEVARMPEVGTKFGRWLDLVLMQRIIT